MSSNKRERGLSNLADDNLHPLLRDDDKLKIIEIYKGSKNFWRARNNIELNFLYHPLLDCIQILGYENSKEVATNILYVSASILNRKVQQTSSFEETFQLKKVEQSRKRAKTTDKEAGVMVLRECLCQYLIARIDLVVLPTSPQSTAATFLPPIVVNGSPKSRSRSNSAVGPALSSLMCRTYSKGEDEDSSTNCLHLPIILKWTPVSSDMIDATSADMKLPYVIDCPTQLLGDSGDNALTLPMKRTSIKASEFAKALSLLQVEQTKLTEASNEANRLLNLTQLGAAGFASSFVERQKREQTYSINKRRWHWAYRRVSIAIFIAKITARLNSIYNNYYGIPVAVTSTPDMSYPAQTTATNARGKNSTKNGAIANSRSLPALERPANGNNRQTIAVTASAKVKGSAVPAATTSAFTAVKGVPGGASAVAAVPVPATATSNKPASRTDAVRRMHSLEEPLEPAITA